MIADGTPAWVDPLCRIAVVFRSGDASIRDLFRAAAPDLNDPRFTERVRLQLEREPSLLEAWQQYSHDKRSTPSPYLEGSEVGFATIAEGKLLVHDVHRYESSTEACARFIRREALWVLEGRTKEA